MRLPQRNRNGATHPARISWPRVKCGMTWAAGLRSLSAEKASRRCMRRCDRSARNTVDRSLPS
jgi:hypothetical protein